MSVKEILREIEALPRDERWQLLEQVRRLIEPEIPESFRAGMEDIKAGRVMDMDEALSETASAPDDLRPNTLRIQSLKGHRVLTPVISQAELADDLFRSP